MNNFPDFCPEFALNDMGFNKKVRFDKFRFQDMTKRCHFYQFAIFIILFRFESSFHEVKVSICQLHEQGCSKCYHLSV